MCSIHILQKNYVPDARAPTLTTSLQENLAVKKYLTFALADIGFQLGQMSRDRKVSPPEFAAAKDGALLISQYLVQTLAEMERMISEASVDEPDPPEEESKAVDLLN